MPQNSQQRCVGIAGAAEALLEGIRQDGKLANVDSVARSIYDNFTKSEPVAYPARLMMGGKSLDIESKAALAALSDQVAKLYKADFHRLAHSVEGVEHLRKAQGDVIKTVDELDEVIAADADRIVFFCCFGHRSFPDRTVKDTSHAVLMTSEDGKYLVYDPNDPGAPVACQTEQSDAGLVVTWKCGYQDQNVETTQRYMIVPQSRYFEALRVRIAKNHYRLIRQSGPNRQIAPEPCPCEK